MRRLANFHRHDFGRLILATLCFGAASGIFTSTVNNYLADVHHFSAEARGWLEFPRELPGFLVILITGFLALRLRETQMASAAMLLSAAGAFGLGFLTQGSFILIAWMFIWSMGDHILFAVEGPIGLKLAREGSEGRRLGQIGGARNLGTIVGVGLVYLIARWQGDRYDLFYLTSACCALLAGLFYLKLRAGHADPLPSRLVFRREYRLFYVISALFGVRKQIFLVFGSWVLVSLHGVSVATIALLYFCAATVGVIMRPLLGDVIDWLGERTVLSVDEIFLVLICLAYATASDLFSAPYDLYILYAAYMLDQVLFALRIARTTYLKKIARHPADITPTVSLGVTIDHAVAMSLPALSGYVWQAFGYRWVFYLAAAIALAGFFVCLRIRVPRPNALGTRGVAGLPG